ncbi:hypothetical protein [Nitratireductor luteus]|uniref:hypothetical protein n=1 Tax=Nitratireductor luteus TaxID=2976980 RepID=UPI00223F88AF|nr:hypothetical protein [Nitratireductor luteus]
MECYGGEPIRAMGANDSDSQRHRIEPVGCIGGYRPTELRVVTPAHTTDRMQLEPT